MSKSKLKQLIPRELHSCINESSSQGDSVSNRFQPIELLEFANPEKSVLLAEVWEESKKLYFPIGESN